MGAIQNSINYALGTAAIASGLTNKKQVDKAQDKLDDKTKELVNKEVQLAKTTAEKDEAQQEIKAINDEEIKQNMYTGGNAYNASNDLPTAKETNITNTAGDNSVNDIKSVNNSIGSSLNDYLKANKKANPYAVEQIMGFHALKMLDSRIAAKKAVEERKNRAMMKIDPLTKSQLEAKEDGTYSSIHGLNLRTMRALKTKEDGTYSFRDGKLVKENLKSGYQVSFFRPEITDENIQSFLKKIGNKLGPAYLGLFEGSPEISYCIKDKDKAMEFAQAFNQYSIWDNKEGKEIRNDKYNESARIDYNAALSNFAKALNNKEKTEVQVAASAKNGGNK